MRSHQLNKEQQGHPYFSLFDDSQSGSDFPDRPNESTDRTGREDEFLNLLARHKYEVFNYIFCIVRSLPDTEDVFQQTSLALWADFAKFRSGTDFLAWALQAARYRALDFIRMKRRERTFFAEPLARQMAEFSEDHAEVYEARLKALSECRQKLPVADQQLLQLCYGGTNMSEAAREVGQTLSAVYGKLFRIRRALSACIERAMAKEGRL